MKTEKKNFIIHPIPVLKDNIIWIWVKGNEAVVIDPAISQPVISWLKDNGVKLNCILQTHHHEDHIGGTEKILEEWPSASVIASKGDIDLIPFQTCSVTGHETLVIINEQIKVISVPGHTKNHIAYFLHRSNKNTPDPVLFCGDTLFGAGCGRLLGGTPNQMFDSLNKIKSLPDNTKIYCAHEYTESNLQWAQSIYPQDLNIRTRLKDVITKRAKGLLTIPSRLSEERKSNLFIRAKTSKEFSELRFHKDNWKR